MYGVQMVLTAELAIKCYAFGLRRAFRNANWVVKLEFIYQPLIYFLLFHYIKFYNENDSFTFEVNLFSIGILLRSLRISALLNEIELWNNFIRTLKALFKPFVNFSMTLYSLYLIYASLGMYLFGGEVNREALNRLVEKYPDFEAESSWLYLNFNDYVMALNTLFGIMWQNDWEGIVYMYELLFDYQKDLAVLMYFISFIVLANLIFVNIIIAFIIDTYLSIDETLNAEK